MVKKNTLRVCLGLVLSGLTGGGPQLWSGSPLPGSEPGSAKPGVCMWLCLGCARGQAGVCTWLGPGCVHGQARGVHVAGLGVCLGPGSGVTWVRASTSNGTSEIPTPRLLQTACLVLSKDSFSPWQRGVLWFFLEAL